MEPAEQLSADRRPIDNRHPPNRRARWRVVPTAASLGRTPVGLAMQPRNVTMQTEGSAIHALGHVLREKITFRNGRVLESNYTGLAAEWNIVRRVS